ncbi:heterokaryon incompatibility protein-domain-containing protein [Xylariaceae sp. FL1019]|nr:heterokaryon incompatibility protein-domain-containing protein [Xylariaceae sp. FL1019]
MPTRLLDVGVDEDNLVRLYEPSAGEDGEYIALSHPWGRGPHLVTDKDNLERFKRNGIKMSIPPGTFRDAVITTRELGKRYLWIDSLCIVQGPGGDFEAQAGRMETVFSSAYCVLAATQAHNQRDGFLQSRTERDYVTLRTRNNAGTFYVCENIDDFNGDVLEGHLNRRGWVLQEHALARRTIFFAGKQTYYECGDGVRCETLTKVTNNLAAFLGDPSFPDIIMSATQGEKIVRFQNLYKTYSGLGFTNDEDRAVAMSGIQSRLLRAFGTQGGYGIFDEVQKDTSGGGLLRRSLLWHCPSGKELTRIRYTRDPRLSGVPSWSWMAYKGAIDYLHPEFGHIDWADVQSPWSSSSLISGMVRDIRKTDDFDEGLFYDVPSEADLHGVRCMVLGVSKGKRPATERRNYVIMVELYQRVGAGYVLGRYLSEEKERIFVH